MGWNWADAFAGFRPILILEYGVLLAELFIFDTMQSRLTSSFWFGMVGYGLAMALLMVALRWFQFRFFLFDHSTEIYFGVVAVLFTSLGMWIAHNLSNTQLTKPQLTLSVSEMKTEVSQEAIDAAGLSRRELEILQMMATGMSNQEIADALFISLSTVKSHVSSVFTKLDVVRRTQAIEKAKTLKIID
jgi:DNA-binding CsgD family transcriptional regulator